MYRGSDLVPHPRPLPGTALRDYPGHDYPAGPRPAPVGCTFCTARDRCHRGRSIPLSRVYARNAGFLNEICGDFPFPFIGPVREFFPGFPGSNPLNHANRIVRSLSPTRRNSPRFFVIPAYFRSRCLGIEERNRVERKRVREFRRRRQRSSPPIRGIAVEYGLDHPDARGRCNARCDLYHLTFSFMLTS